MDKTLFNVMNLYEKRSFLSRFFLYRSLQVIPYQKIESHVSREGNILDFGCGHGLFTNLMALSSKRRDVIGCDIDEHKVKIALKTIQSRKNVHFYKEDIMNYNEKFTSITIVSVLYLIPYKKQEEILRHLINLLAEDGKLIIVEFDKKPKWKYYWGYMREYLMTSIYTKNEGLYYRSSNEYFSLFKRFNLDTKVYPLGMSMYPSVIYVCSKNIYSNKPS